MDANNISWGKNGGVKIKYEVKNLGGEIWVRFPFFWQNNLGQNNRVRSY